MVHSSLSACGRVMGGAFTVIKALREWSAGANLAMPAHSYCYRGRCGACPIFDVQRSPSVVGAITETFRRQAAVQRSLHPTHSLACKGPGAARLIAGHELCDTPCGAGTPYEKLVAEDASVLMFGVSLNSYTLFHTAEHAAAVPYLYCEGIVSLRIRAPGGEVRSFPRCAARI